MLIVPPPRHKGAKARLVPLLLQRQVATLLSVSWCRIVGSERKRFMLFATRTECAVACSSPRCHLTRATYCICKQRTLQYSRPCDARVMILSRVIKKTIAGNLAQ